ncbi:Nuclear transcription factor Y subunit B-9 [Acorus calamus]|uniref:Nuclear transcription factor Y subunit B-9 n=1 Tax=Acorus calamus TaxID=4465 RepID=A0AAV9EAX0_ACOCL|nr:Nuclear transcription factor Y subunit B-9 [Acorus calamus]
MRKVLPAHAKISDDAKETIQECVSEYISFITGEANDRCQSEQRKTVTAEDVLWAMSKLGFDDYVDPLSLYLRRYREVEGDLRGSIRGDPHGLSLLHPPPPPPPPPRRAHGPLRSLSGPPAHEFGGYGPVWEQFYGDGGGGGGGYVNAPGVGPSHGPGPSGYEAYGPPPPYK